MGSLINGLDYKESVMNKFVAHYKDAIQQVERDLQHRPELRDVLEPELRLARKNLALAKRVLGLYA